MLTIEQLSVARGARFLVQGLDFTLASGQALWIQGANGSGKTTLLRTVVGLYPPETGHICWNRVPIAQSEEFGAQLLYIGHLPALQPLLTVEENLAFFAALSDLSLTTAAFHNALERVGLAQYASFPVRTLSAGQQRRVALARLFLEAQKILWCLDEPFTALDTLGVAFLETTLLAHLDQGGMVLFTSHQPPQQARLRQRRLVLDYSESTNLPSP